MPGFGQAPFARQQGMSSASGMGLQLAQVTPSDAWDGTAGSGFISAPVDPSRITAKPVISLLTLERQYFADTLRIDVMAFANDGGTLINGIDRVRFYFEDDTPVDVVEHRLRSFTRFDGSTYLLPVYSVMLARPSEASGNAHLYIEAVPADATMQSRVLGPIQFSPHKPFATGSIHDVELSVDPASPTIAGSNYHSWTAAHRYLAGLNPLPENPRITVSAPAASASGKHLIESTGGATFAPNGWLTVEATTPVTFGRDGGFVSAQEATSGGSRPRLDAVRMLGRNITIDCANMHIYSEFDTFGRGWAFEGVSIINPPGLEQNWMGQGRQENPCRGRNFYIDCSISDLPRIGSTQMLLRGNICRDMWFDFSSNIAALVGNICNGLTNEFWLTEVAAFSVQYVGSGSAATISLDGANNQDRTLTAKIDGAIIGSLPLHKPVNQYDPSRNERMEDVVDWFNGLPDWTATLLNNDRNAVLMTLPYDLADQFGSGTKGSAFNDYDAKSSSVTFGAMHDLHGDFYQSQNSSINLENVLIYGNRVSQMAAQKLFIAGTAPVNDLVALNNALGDKDSTFVLENPDFFTSQFSRAAHSHVVVAHNSLEQRLKIRTDEPGYSADAYSLLSNNVFEDIVYAAGDTVDIVVSDNHLFAGAIGPGNGTGTTEGGDETSLFTDADAGDFSPQGELLAPENVKPPVVIHDIGGQSRGEWSPVGAEHVNVPPPPPAPPPPPPPASNFAAFENAVSGNSSAVDFTTTSSDPFLAEDLTVLGNDWIEALGGTDPVASGNGIVGTGGTECIGFPASSGTFTLIISATLDSSDTDQQIVTTNAASTVIRMTSGSGSALPVAAEIDGGPVATRGEFFAAATAGGEVTILVSGINLDGKSELNLGRSFASFKGSIRRACVIDEAATTGQDLTDARTFGAAWVSES